MLVELTEEELKQVKQALKPLNEDLSDNASVEDVAEKLRRILINEQIIRWAWGKALEQISDEEGGEAEEIAGRRLGDLGPYGIISEGFVTGLIEQIVNEIVEVANSEDLAEIED